MRRPITVCVTLLAVTVALAGAGCAHGDDPEAIGSPGSGATGAPSDGPPPGGPSGGATKPPGGPLPTAKAGGNAAEVCAAVLQASATGTTAYVTELGAILQAQGTGDNTAAGAAEKRLEAALDTWSAALKTQSTTATDAQLKSVLGDLGAEIDKMGTKVESIDDGKLGAIQDRLDALCPE